MNITVIFVDDDPRCIDSLRRSMSDIPLCKEWEILFFTSPTEALAACAGRDISAIVTDEHMPGMSGRELIQSLKATSPGLAALLFTGDASDATEKDIMMIEKPCNTESLIALLGDLLTANTKGERDE